MTQLDLQDLQVLSDLQVALARFAQDAQESLRRAQNEIHQTQEWLQERNNHWQRQVNIARRAVVKAEADLAACQASGSRDRQGNYVPPDCRQQIRVLAQTRSQLHDCEENLQTTHIWRGRVEQGINSYNREAHRLQYLANEHTQKSLAYLQKSLNSYQKVLEAANIVGIAANLTVGGILWAAGAFVKGVRMVIGRENNVMGAAAEDVAEQVAIEELGLSPVEFDRKHKGFDRILQGPNGNYMVLESKKSDAGKLHLDPNSYGYRQTSVGWVRHLAQQMTTPGSEFYSETNARIGQKMLDMGAANVPVIATVTNPIAGSVDIYLRTGPDALADDWAPLEIGILLEKPK